MIHTREDAMASRSDERKLEVNRALLLGGVVLISAGTLLWTVGGVATATALIGAARSWMRQLDEPPSATARRRWSRSRFPPGCAGAPATRS